MNSEVCSHLEAVRSRLRKRSRLEKCMVRIHKISRQLAAWHVERMTDAQVAEELDRYAKSRRALPLEASA